MIKIGALYAVLNILKCLSTAFTIRY